MTQTEFQEKMRKLDDKLIEYRAQYVEFPHKRDMIKRQARCIEIAKELLMRRHVTLV